MSETILYGELNKQACVRREVHGEIKNLVEEIYWRPGIDNEKKLETILASVRERMSLSVELVALSSTLRKRIEEIT